MPEQSAFFRMVETLTGFAYFSIVSHYVNDKLQQNCL